jgi:nucleoid-associated protein YgaU
MELEKATLNVVIGKGGDPVEVLFNPGEYSLSGSNQFAEVAVPGLPAPPLQFVRGNVRTLSMQLFFDTYEKGSDVREHTRKVTRLLDIDPELHAPPVVLFTWGGLNFTGVLERAEQRFTLFYASGIPARATVNVTFKEFTQGDEQAGKNIDKRRTVRRGDTLNGIAGREFGDPANWRPIAEANGIDDPLSLQPGQVLLIPAIE